MSDDTSWMLPVHLADFTMAASDDFLICTCNKCGAEQRASECVTSSGETVVYRCRGCSAPLATIVDTTLFPDEHIGGYPHNEFRLRTAVQFIDGNAVLAVLGPLFSIRYDGTGPI